MLKGLQRAAKKWNSTIYLLFTQDIIEEAKENLLADLCDGVIVFRWQEVTRATHRNRYMFVPKFTGVLPHLDRRRISRFFVRIDYRSGFVVANTERI